MGGDDSEKSDDRFPTRKQSGRPPSNYRSEIQEKLLDDPKSPKKTKMPRRLSSPSQYKISKDLGEAKSIGELKEKQRLRKFSLSDPKMEKLDILRSNTMNVGRILVEKMSIREEREERIR